ncbi:MAG: hypothetical protein ABIC91_07630 [Nanoarchaeota archaeon]
MNIKQIATELGYNSIMECIEAEWYNFSEQGKEVLIRHGLGRLKQ